MSQACWLEIRPPPGPVNCVTTPVKKLRAPGACFVKPSNRFDAVVEPVGFDGVEGSDPFGPGAGFAGVGPGFAGVCGFVVGPDTGFVGVTGGGFDGLDGVGLAPPPLPGLGLLGLGRATVELDGLFVPPPLAGRVAAGAAASKDASSKSKNSIAMFWTPAVEYERSVEPL